MLCQRCSLTTILTLDKHTNKHQIKLSDETPFKHRPRPICPLEHVLDEKRPLSTDHVQYVHKTCAEESRSLSHIRSGFETKAETQSCYLWSHLSVGNRENLSFQLGVGDMSKKNISRLFSVRITIHNLVMMHHIHRVAIFL